jgi:hypothetical protein
MALKTLYMLKPRQEQTSGDNNRRAKFIELMRPGIEQVKRERRNGAEHYDPDAVPGCG